MSFALALLKHRVTFGVALGGLLVTLAGCMDTPVGPPAPVSVKPTGPQPGPQPVPGFPPVAPVANVAGTYDRITPSVFPAAQRYVLYDDSTFSLQYSSPLGLEYKGTYSRADSLLTFNWDGWSSAGPWGADGIVRGDTLIVKYNIIMQMTDFEDGTYVRTFSGSP